MPEFVLDIGSKEGAARWSNLSTFAQGYVEAMFFTSTGDLDDGDVADGTFDQLSPDALRRIVKDCRSFKYGPGREALEGLESSDLTFPDEQQAGRDFWYTRSGHGCGFWDGDWPEPYASRLTQAAKSFHAVYLVRGDDGLLYLE